MTIRARCPHCDGELAFEDTEGDAERECPECHGGLRVPSVIHYTCVTCDYRYQSGPQHIGRHFKCRQCEDLVTVPETSIPTTHEVTAEGEMVGRFSQRVDRAGFSGSSGADGESTADDWFEDADGDQAGAHRPATGLPKRVSRQMRRIEHAGFFLRVAASLVDGVILSVVQFLGGFVVGVLYGFLGDGLSEAALVPVSMVGGFVLNLLYFTLMESSGAQATLGKRLVGIGVTDVDGEQISFARAAARYLGKIPSAILCGIGFLMVAFTPNKQGLHDFIAGTYVVRM